MYQKEKEEEKLKKEQKEQYEEDIQFFVREMRKLVEDGVR